MQPMENINLLIENYLTGSMPEGQIVDFEKFIETNPSAKAELEFQRNVIKGIQATKRARLKSELASMNPNIGLSITQKLGIAASVLMAISVVAVSYFSIVNQENSTESILSNSTTQIEQDVVVNSTTETLISQPQIDKQELEPTVIESEGNNTPTIQPVETENSIVAVDVHSSESITEQTSETFRAPHMDMNEYDKDVDYHQTSEEIEANGFGTSHIDKTITPSIDKNCNSESEGYTFSENQLKLCGDFDLETFTVFYGEGSDNLYFFYQNEYYHIVESNSFQLLEHHTVKDASIIKTLKKAK